MRRSWSGAKQIDQIRQLQTGCMVAFANGKINPLDPERGWKYKAIDKDLLAHYILLGDFPCLEAVMISFRYMLPSELKQIGVRRIA